MARGYRRVDREQGLLLPPSMADWLPADHLVWFVIGVVEQLDTAVFRAQPKRRTVVGRAGFDPDMLLTLLIYAYAHGVRSSRQIEAACHTDVAYRIICGQQPPDHTVIARFRRRHEAGLAELFEQVLVVCARAGLGRFGRVALDGTKIAADASMDRSRDEDGLRRLAQRWLDEAEAIDAAEDAEAGQDRPDRVPPTARDPQRIQALLEDIEAERRARAEQAKAEQVEALQRRLAAAEATLARARAVQQAKTEAWQQRAAQAETAGRKPAGRPPKDEDFLVLRSKATVDKLRTELATRHATPAQPDPTWQPRRNLTDPDSRLLPTRHGWIQGYNCQLAVTDDHLIIAADVCQDSTDWAQFPPMLAAINHSRHHISTATGLDTTIGTLLADAGYASRTNLTTNGPDRLIALGKHHQPTGHTRLDPDQPPPTDPDPRTHMAWRLAHPDNARTYRRRAALAEPINAHLKDRRGLRRFARRGLTAARSELRFAAAVTNLLRLRRHQLATTG